LSLFVLLKNRRAPINIIFCFLSFAAFGWQLTNFFLIVSVDAKSAAFWISSMYYFVFFIPVLIYHMSILVRNARNQLKFLIASYLIIFLIFFPLHIKGYIVESGSYSFWTFWGKPGQLHGIFLIFFFYVCAVSIFNFYKAYTEENNLVEKNRKKYLLFAFSLSLLGSVDYASLYNQRIYPFGCLALFLILSIIAYAIVKHQLMDIKVVFTRAGLFLLVYSVVLGVPFWIGYKTQHWFIPTILATLFSSFGFLVYNHLRLVIERRFFYQEKLQLAETEQHHRQRSMDNFSASLAHEIQNPVYAVMGLAGVIRESVLADLKGKIDEKLINHYAQRLTQLESDAARVAKIIKAVRDYSAKDAPDFTAVKVDELLESFVYLAGPQFKAEQIDFIQEITPGLIITGSKVQLEELLLNLAENAIHAVSGNPVEKGKRITLTMGLQGNHISIEFRDNGYGIKPELLEDIFLDFVTTKGSSEGLGMGLSHCRKIVNLHKGRIWARSEGEGKGAAILVELPHLC
jgi:signal transduction histidine kinase